MMAVVKVLGAGGGSVGVGSMRYAKRSVAGRNQDRVGRACDRLQTAALVRTSRYVRPCRRENWCSAVSWKNSSRSWRVRGIKAERQCAVVQSRVHSAERR